MMNSPVSPGPTLTAVARGLLATGKKNRIVIKVGSALLVEDKQIATSRIHELCHLIADLSERYEVLLVTSGAVAMGSTEVPLDKSTMPNKQALAALGQPLLMHLYYTEFQKFGLFCAQMLLDSHDFDSRKRTANAANAIEVLLANKIIPVINENDATATAEIAFGDNDQMSAHVAMHFNAHLLVILSDIDGYYSDNPKTNPEAKLRRHVHQLTIDELSAPATPNNFYATGGIVTKLKAAQFMIENNRKMLLTNGYKLDLVRAFLLDGVHEIGTVFSNQ
uniref:Glutamate 5-kinase n=1 Tax=Herpetomonas muscarum TaxID=5718 RepID=U5KLI5_HERMU|nr:glutamate 5-kinase [Herpetomonas muscarum]